MSLTYGISIRFLRVFHDARVNLRGYSIILANQIKCFNVNSFFNVI